MTRFLASSGYDDQAKVQVISDAAKDLADLTDKLPHDSSWMLDWAHIGRKLWVLDQSLTPLAYGRLTPKGSAFELWDLFVRFRCYVSRRYLWCSGLNEFAPSSGSVTSVVSGVNNTSVWGFRGSEDLGGGLKAVFNLEQGYNADTGAQATATKVFDRQAWVGLQNSWGTLTAGRHRNLLGDAVSPVDPLGMRIASFNPNINIASLSQHRLGIDYGAAGSTTGSYRLDNSVKATARLSDVTLRAMASAGEGASGHSLGASATYVAGPLSLSGGYTQFENLAERPIDAWVVGGGYRFGPARVTLTYGDNKAETSATAETRNKTLGAGLSYTFTPSIELITSYYRVDRERTGRIDDGFDRVIAFLEYSASKRTKLYAELDSTRWKDGYQGAGFKEDGTGVSLGIVHNF